jgi:L-threonylcarbamoyladenylate synthase
MNGSSTTSDLDKAVRAVRAGEPVVLPFDTVYGLAADPGNEAAVQRLYELKGRGAEQPSALVAAGVDQLLDCVPELRGADELLLRRLLPGPLTLVVRNPARRLAWLSGRNPDTIGVRVPDLGRASAEVLRAVAVLVATSANRPGEADPRRLDEVPEEIRRDAGAVVDGGELPGTPSTVIDLTGSEPRILREGAMPAAEALRRLGAAVRSG